MGRALHPARRRPRAPGRRRPAGAPPPRGGALPAEARARLGQLPFGAYLHVPYCTTRCGYCDFNTYTAQELGPGVSRATWAASVTAEIRLAARGLGGGAPAVSTVFFGGGTPTLLPPEDLAAALAA